MAGRPRKTDTNEEKILHLLKRGLTVRQIAHECGTTRSMVQRVKERNGVKIVSGRRR